MTRLSNLRNDFEDSSEIASAVGDLTEFATVLVTGSVVGGPVLTIPLIVAYSGKATAAALRLVKALLPTSKEEKPCAAPAELVDAVFHALAQKSYLEALQRLSGRSTENGKFNQALHKQLTEALELRVVKPFDAEASFSFDWDEQNGAVQLFDSFNAWLGALLTSMDVSPEVVGRWMKEIDSQARRNLHRELVSREEDRTWLVHYQLLERTADILEVVKGFSAGTITSGEVSWNAYFESIANKPNLPIWGEEEQGLGIAQLFVEPAFEYRRQSRSAGTTTQTIQEGAISLTEFLVGLLTTRRPSTELTFVMGGPGSGKTSFMEVFAAMIAESRSMPIILIQAKKLDPQKSILPQVQDLLRESGHAALADLFPSTSGCVLAIDGFDELAFATRTSLATFFREAQELVRSRSEVGLKILLSGRPTLFAVNDVAIPQGSHVIALEPFDKKRVFQWSENWCNSTGGSFEGTKYFESSSADIRELSSQPMLLYLLARMHEDGVPLPHSLEVSGGRFQIYERILNWICQRQVEKTILTGLKAPLRRFLQIAGLATHQSGQRALHWREFERALKQAGLVEDPRELESRAHATILSFAFTNLQERAWEFTHKSFGEALAAEAIGRVLADIAEPGVEGERWRVPLADATLRWAQTFGANFLTRELLDLVAGWLRTKPTPFVVNLVPRLFDVFKRLIGHGAVEALSSVTVGSERPLHVVLANSLRSWFAVTSAVLKQLKATNGKDSTDIWIGSLNVEQFRLGVYMCSIASPIQSGESEYLLDPVAELLEDATSRHTQYFRSELMKFRAFLRGLESEVKTNSKRQLRANSHQSVLERWSHARSFEFEYVDFQYFSTGSDRMRSIEFTNSMAVFEGSRGLSHTPAFAFPPPAIEASFANLEEAIQRGLEASPAVEVFRMAGIHPASDASREVVGRLISASNRLLSSPPPKR